MLRYGQIGVLCLHRRHGTLTLSIVANKIPDQRDICCAKEVHRRSFLLPSSWSCDLSSAFAPHVMSEPKCISCRLLYGCQNVSSWECVHLSVFATWMTRTMVLAHHRILWARAATETVHGLLGGAANSGHRNRDVIATALKDLPHANRNA